MQIRLGLLIVLCFAAAASAQVKPGDVIGKKDADRIKDLVSPGIVWLVQRGMEMKIIPRRFGVEELFDDTTRAL